MKSPFKFRNKYRCCHSCGAPYYRANRMRLWTVTNFGYQKGWKCEDVKLCCKCFNGKKAIRVVELASVHVIPPPQQHLRAVR